MHTMCNNSNGTKRIIFFSGIGWYYGDLSYEPLFHCMFRRNARDLQYGFSICKNGGGEPGSVHHVGDDNDKRFKQP